MIFKKILNPLIKLMNKFSFKSKIVASVSVLFILLIMPSKTTLMNYIGKEKTYDEQLVALKYIKKVHSLIYYLELHRGGSNAYISGNKTFKNDILKNEKIIKQKFNNILKFDRKNFNKLTKCEHFIDAISQIDMISFKNYEKGFDAKVLFKLHNKIIEDLITSLQKVTTGNSFASSTNGKINFIAELLQEKLLLLQENTAQLRGIVVGVFAKHKIVDEQMSDIFTKYTFIKSLESILLDDKVLYNTQGFLATHKISVELDYKLNQMLKIINNNIILYENLTYSSEKFFKIATDVINTQTKLYNIYVQTYQNIIMKMKRKNEFIFTLLLVGFFIIVGSALYIFGALFYSVTDSLKKLQKATILISRGETKIHLKVDTKDEIGKALQSFNKMSQKLDKSISFLNGYKMAIDETSIVSKTNSKGIITYVNKQFCELAGYSERELLGRTHNIIRHPDMPKEVFIDMWKTIKSKKIWKGIVKNRTKNGGYYIVDATIIPVVDENNEIVEFIGIRHDITELERTKEEIKKQKIDIKTGLYTGVQLQKDIVNMKKPILLYLNIDNFSQINDFYGEKIGDNVLVFITKSLKEIFENEVYKIYKHHNDEFMLVFEESVLDITKSKKLILKVISQIEEKTKACDEESCVALTMSGGISHYQLDSSHKSLLSLAIKARKIAKDKNKKYLVFNHDMNKESDYKKNIEWIHKIKDAIENDRIVAYFQPIVDNKKGYITKYESLVRLVEKDGKVVSPFFFLEISKKAKLYSQITKIMIDKTLKQLNLTPQYEFSINLTVEDIKDSDTKDYIIKSIEECKYREKIVFEITESEEIEDYQVINSFISEVKNYGVKIAIDDFGSGYANFEHIIELKADFIKIDGSLIKDIVTNKEAEIVTEAILSFSKKIGAKTIAEYIHSWEVQEKVLSLGADFSQGFYLGEPSLELIETPMQTV